MREEMSDPGDGEAFDVILTHPLARGRYAHLFARRGKRRVGAYARRRMDSAVDNRRSCAACARGTVLRSDEHGDSRTRMRGAGAPAHTSRVSAPGGSEDVCVAAERDKRGAYTAQLVEERRDVGKKAVTKREHGVRNS